MLCLSKLNYLRIKMDQQSVKFQDSFVNHTFFNMKFASHQSGGSIFGNALYKDATWHIGEPYPYLQAQASHYNNEIIPPCLDQAYF